jgi:hypothetical protein
MSLALMPATISATSDRIFVSIGEAGADCAEVHAIPSTTENE